MSATGIATLTRGTCAYNATTKEFKVLSVLVDTTGCAGLRDPDDSALASFSLTLSADGSPATAVSSDGTFQLLRASR